MHGNARVFKKNIDEKENYTYAERIINETEKALSFIAENPYNCTPTDYENIRKVFVA